MFLMEQIQQHEWKPHRKIEKCAHCGATKFSHDGIIFYWVKGINIMSAQRDEPPCITRPVNAPQRNAE